MENLINDDLDLSSSDESDSESNESDNDECVLIIMFKTVI